jgi:hypothetical protein
MLMARRRGGKREGDAELSRLNCITAKRETGER